MLDTRLEKDGREEIGNAKNSSCFQEDATECDKFYLNHSIRVFFNRFYIRWNLKSNSIIVQLVPRITTLVNCFSNVISHIWNPIPYKPKWLFVLINVIAIIDVLRILELTFFCYSLLLNHYNILICGSVSIKYFKAGWSLIERCCNHRSWTRWLRSRFFTFVLWPLAKTLCILHT